MEARIFNPQYVICIKDGKLGIWFYRKPPASV